MSPIAINLWLTTGATLQCLAILWARGLAPKDWLGPLAGVAVLPLILIAYVAALASPALGQGTAFMAPLIAGFTAGWALMYIAPPRIGAATVLSLSVTFWAAFWPERGPLPGWVVFAAPLTILAAAYAAAPWPPPRFLRLVLFVWYLIAAGMLAASSMSRKALEAGLENWPVAAEPLTLLLTGAQLLLVLQTAAGLLMLVPVTGEGRKWKEAWATVRRNADSFMSAYDVSTKPGWTALIVIAAQAVVLGALRRAEPSMQTEMIRMAALAAMAHGAMSGGPEKKKS